MAAQPFSQTFPLPAGFSVKGTDIGKCFDPEMGYLTPQEDVVYTFLLNEDGNYAIHSATAKEMESTLVRLGGLNYIKVYFVCPRIPEPNHIINPDKYQFYIEGMIKEWNKYRQAQGKVSQKPEDCE